jgi:flagellar motor switch protein FliG
LRVRLLTDDLLMTNVDRNLRKAAVLLRSLDVDTAAVMLGQLSAEEAATIHAAMRSVGHVATEEQADVMAELRGARPAKITSGAGDVELTLSSSYSDESYVAHGAIPIGDNIATSSKRFEFLESAPTHALVLHLGREQAQTIAVVLSHLPPERAAAVLAALPQKQQAETIERLSTLGEMDPECVSVLRRELEAWAAERDGLRAGNGRRRDTMAAILAAADAKSRGQILSNMKDHKAALAEQFSPRHVERRCADAAVAKPQGSKPRVRSADEQVGQLRAARSPAEVRLPRFDFDDLAELDSRTLPAVLRQADPNVLALALAGSRDELVERICEQMPKRTAREFRRQLRRLGPTRLSDVEGAQRAVAQIAAKHLADGRQTLATSRV